MTNKKLLLLLCISLVSSATHSMKRSHSEMIKNTSSSITTSKSKTIKKLQLKRDQFYNRIKHNPINLYLGISSAITPMTIESFYQNKYGDILYYCKHDYHLQAYKENYIPIYSISGKRTGKYSLLGVATMTVQNELSYQKTSYFEKKNL